MLFLTFLRRCCEHAQRSMRRCCEHAPLRMLTASQNQTFRHYSTIINWRSQNWFWIYSWLIRQRLINCLDYTGRLLNCTRTCTALRCMTVLIRRDWRKTWKHPGRPEFEAQAYTAQPKHQCFPPFCHGTVPHSYNFRGAPDETIIVHTKPKQTTWQISNNNNNNNKYQHGWHQHVIICTCSQITIVLCIPRSKLKN
jgi:hypothetical protein